MVFESFYFRKHRSGTFQGLVGSQGHLYLRQCQARPPFVIQKVSSGVGGSERSWSFVESLTSNTRFLSGLGLVGLVGRRCCVVISFTSFCNDCEDSNWWAEKRSKFYKQRKDSADVAFFCAIIAISWFWLCGVWSFPGKLCIFRFGCGKIRLLCFFFDVASMFQNKI